MRHRRRLAAWAAEQHWTLLPYGSGTEAVPWRGRKLAEALAAPVLDRNDAEVGAVLTGTHGGRAAAVAEYHYVAALMGPPARAAVPIMALGVQVAEGAPSARIVRRGIEAVLWRTLARRGGTRLERRFRVLVKDRELVRRLTGSGLADLLLRSGVRLLDLRGGDMVLVWRDRIDVPKLVARLDVACEVARLIEGNKPGGLEDSPPHPRP